MRVSTSMRCSGVVGWKRSWYSVLRISRLTVFSPRMIWDLASMPDFRAFMREAALPSAELGPVDFFALRRLASVCFWDAIHTEGSVATSLGLRGMAVRDRK